MSNRATLLPTLVASLLCASFSASAQTLTPPLLPPPPPAWVPTSDSVSAADALEAEGRRKKRVGAALMVSGSALMVAGGGLLIAGSWHGDHPCDGRNYDYRSYGHGCGDHALTLAGGTTTLIGFGALVPGIIESVAGGNLVERARRLRQCGGLCW